jgi:hypothetical protein
VSTLSRLQSSTTRSKQLASSSLLHGPYSQAIASSLQARRADPYCRLRVPQYLKAYEVVFFGFFLFFYYYVLTHRSYSRVTWDEIMLYLWLAGFAYNELGEILDAGRTFLPFTPSSLKLKAERILFLPRRFLVPVGFRHHHYWNSIPSLAGNRTQLGLL